jgi:hypothetical protein
MSHRSEINSILKQVEEWTAEDRRALASELLRRGDSSTASIASTGTVSQRPSLGALLGIANPQGRALADEGLDGVRFQALKESHGL